MAHVFSAGAAARSTMSVIAPAMPQIDAWQGSRPASDTVLLDLKAREDQSPPALVRLGRPGGSAKAAQPARIRVLMISVVVMLAFALSAGVAAVVAGSVFAGASEEDAETVFVGEGGRAAAGPAASAHVRLTVPRAVGRHAEAGVQRLHSEPCTAPCYPDIAEFRSPPGSDSPVVSDPCQHADEEPMTADAVCAIVRDDKLLAIKRGSGEFELPGGRSDGVAPARCTAYRRTLELTGQRAVPRGLLFMQQDGVQVYACELVDPRPRLRRSGRAASEVSDAEVSWLSRSEVAVSSGAWRSLEADLYLSLLP